MNLTSRRRKKTSRRQMKLNSKQVTLSNFKRMKIWCKIIDKQYHNLVTCIEALFYIHFVFLLRIKIWFVLTALCHFLSITGSQHGISVTNVTQRFFLQKNWSFLFITRLRCWYSMRKFWYDMSEIYVILRAFLSCLLKMNIMYGLLETI